MKTLEEVTYDAGRAALADQESFVAGIRQRTGTLLAAQALVASFLGGAAIRAHGFHALAWLAMASLVGALLVAAVVLGPWRLTFALSARDLYALVSPLANAQTDDRTVDWLTAAAFAHESLRDENTARVRLMARLSAVLATLMLVQTLLWLAALGLD